MKGSPKTAQNDQDPAHDEGADSRLKAAGNHYNETVTGLIGKQGLHGKVERFQQLSAKANKEMAKLEPLHSDIENDRLSLVVDNQDSGDKSRLEDSKGKT